MKMKKTAQIEMIGLVIIVFLLALGILFLVSVTSEDNAKILSTTPQNVMLAQNTIDAMKNIKLDCPPPLGKKVGYDDLLRDIGTDNRIYCNGTSSNDFTELVSSNILKSTLGNWSKPYSFSIVKTTALGEKVVFFTLNDLGCTAESEGTSWEQPFPLRGGAGNIKMMLHICD